MDKCVILLYGHGGSENHGCEAIVRSTNQIIQKFWGSNVSTILSSPASEQDIKYCIDDICTIENVRPGKKNIDFFKAYIKLKFKKHYEDLDTYPFHSVLKKYKESILALSIGGDNYCYGNNTVIRKQHEIFHNAGIRSVLWGCSIEPKVLDKTIDFTDISNYTYIIARESLTYNALKEHGITNVSLYPDPAFTLKKKEVDLPLSNLVGINLSPMIMNYERSGVSAYNNYDRLINYIIEKTDLNIALIPHVVWETNDDRKPLRKLYNKYNNSRLLLIEDNDAEYLKGVISQCRFMLAARTHASIAAYSTCVPTLVVGYSIKAKGIAKDIFGTDDNYVLPVQSLRTENDLLEKFEWLIDNEVPIKKHLQNFMPAYIDRAWEAGKILKSYCL
jgi:polysaccharide pyruvyl transferase WcaK-like protein